MYAIVRQGDGKYYTSVVFGYYQSVTATDDYQRYLERIHNRWFIVLNAEKTALVKQVIYDPNNKYLIPLVLITDEDTSGWTLREDYQGAVDFLPEAALFEMVERGEVPEELLRRCIELDKQARYEPYPEIRTQRDIENLECVSGYFHDAYIDKLETLENGALYLLFDGVWGCKIEMWFAGDVAYAVESRNPEKWDQYWMDSTVLLQDGYIWLIDDADMTPEELNDGYCWFRARRVKYHVIPD